MRKFFENFWKKWEEVDLEATIIVKQYILDPLGYVYQNRLKEYKKS